VVPVVLETGQAGRVAFARVRASVPSEREVSDPDAQAEEQASQEREAAEQDIPIVPVVPEAGQTGRAAFARVRASVPPEREVSDPDAQAEEQASQEREAAEQDIPIVPVVPEAGQAGRAVFVPGRVVPPVPQAAPACRVPALHTRCHVFSTH
jgi:hypothetical protein